MDTRRKSSSKLKWIEKIEYGFGCGAVGCTYSVLKCTSISARNKLLEKHKKDTGHTEIYRWVCSDYYETS